MDFCTREDWERVHTIAYCVLLYFFGHNGKVDLELFDYCFDCSEFADPSDVLDVEAATMRMMVEVCERGGEAIVSEIVKDLVRDCYTEKAVAAEKLSSLILDSSEAIKRCYGSEFVYS